MGWASNRKRRVRFPHGAYPAIRLPMEAIMLSITRRIAYITWEGERKLAYVRNFTLVG